MKPRQRQELETMSSSGSVAWLQKLVVQVRLVRRVPLRQTAGLNRDEVVGLLHVGCLTGGVLSSGWTLMVLKKKKKKKKKKQKNNEEEEDAGLISEETCDIATMFPGSRELAETSLSVPPSLKGPWLQANQELVARSDGLLPIINDLDKVTGIGSHGTLKHVTVVSYDENHTLEVTQRQLHVLIWQPCSSRLRKTMRGNLFRFL